MTRRARAEAASGFTVLLVDDNADYLQATRLLLEREGHNVLTATNGVEALDILPKQRVDLLLLDYFMPGMTGEQVVAELRKFDPLVQVILQTGYASERPPRELLQRLNIQGYYDKTEGPEQLLLWTTVGLKAAETIQQLVKSRQAVEYILEKTPELHRIQSTDSLSQEIVQQVTRLLSQFGGSPEATGALATLDSDADLFVRTKVGAHESGGKARALLDPAKLEALARALQEAQVKVGPDGTIVPLRVGPLTAGVVWVDEPSTGSQTVEFVRMLANQAAVALQNAQLYELATIDALTGAHVRSFFEQTLVRELAASLRGKQAVALVLIDIDGMKAINEKAGHVAGDQALRALGKALREAIRAGDVVGRYEGDAFAVVLRDPTTVGPARLGARVHELLKDQKITTSSGDVPLRASIGFSLLEPPPQRNGGEGRKPIGISYFQLVADLLKGAALLALDDARRSGGNTVKGSELVAWPND
ncbi:MAG: diguanylate cyclase [Polyangiaceae bacterium]